jgi:hypothetical protein
MPRDAMWNDDPPPAEDVLRRRRLRRGLIGAGLALAGLAAAILYGLTSVPYSDGYRQGEIQKITAKGWVVKAVEGELALPGSRGNRTLANAWAFSVSDPAVARQLAELPLGTPVRLYYHQYAWCPLHDSNYLVWKAESLAPATPPKAAP